MIGRVIGNYKIESKLGEGGMGAVYKGVDTMLDREVAIKALRPELASQTSVVERFRSEAVTLAKLHHPNIATLYSLFRQTDELYMVLEYVRGETLDSILQRRGALSSNEVIPVFCQILDGIDHAHELGIVHRDIKPANMMLTEKGTLKVLDFGIARLLGTNRMTRAGNVIGTLEYMPPEQVKGQETDARSDIYSLGMMLYEVLTGRAPFESENEFELMKLQTEAMPAPPRALNASIPAEVESAIMRAIQKSPDARFQTAGEFREALLDAGFAAHGAMRRNSGSHQTPGNTFSATANSFAASQFISKPDAVLETPAVSRDVIGDTNPSAAVSQSSEVKETRLGGAPVSQPHEIKQTRLGAGAGAADIEDDIPFASAVSEPSASFFDKLSWVHYAGAGAGALVGVVLLVIVSVFAFSGSSTPAVNALQAKPSVTPPAETQARQVATTPVPTVTPTPQPVMQPVSAQTPEPIYTDPTPAPTATPAKPAPAERAKNNPPDRKAAPAPTKKTVTRRPPQPSARCLLTGDC